MNRSIDLPFDINKNMSRGTDNHPVGMENRFGRGEWTFHERFRIVNFPPVSVVGFLETTWKIRKEERKKNYCIKLLFASGAKFGRWRRSTVGRKKKNCHGILYNTFFILSFIFPQFFSSNRFDVSRMFCEVNSACFEWYSYRERVGWPRKIRK